MKKRFFLWSLAGALLVIVSLPAACGRTPATTQPATTPPLNGGDNHQVAIKDLAYNPQEVTIKVGDTVTWLNEDSAPHTVTSWVIWFDEDENAHVFIGDIWDSGDIEPGQTYSRTFDEAGIYEYVSLPLYLYIMEYIPAFFGTVVVAE